MTGLSEPSAQTAASASLPASLIANAEPAPPGELRIRVAAHELEAAARTLRKEGARFVTAFRAGMPQPSVVVAVALRGELVLVRAPWCSASMQAVESIGGWWPAAKWPTQELIERATTTQRKTPPTTTQRLTAPDPDALDRRLQGLDVFTIPYGPVRSGIFEAIQFRIETGGEDVPSIQTRPFFKHRAMESRFEGLRPDVAVHVAERVAGIAGCAHASAFAQAVERSLGVTAPARAQRWRTVHAELERMACHLDVIAKEAETAALQVGQAGFSILKEQVMRLRAQLTGSRFARGVIVPGGVRAAGAMAPSQLRATLDDLERALVRERRLFVGTASMTDRLIGTGRLERRLVEDHGAVGPLARGSGVSTDARHERPYGEYAHLGVRVVTRREGDAMARVGVRLGELSESLRLVRQCADRLRGDEGPLLAALPGGDGAACGWVEAPQGELVVWVEIRGGVLAHVHIASPSLRNWALFDLAFPHDVLTDFAFIEHSFGLTAAGADR